MKNCVCCCWCACVNVAICSAPQWWLSRQVAAVCTCLMAVRKPCGLKKPVIQKQLGRPSKIQARNCRSRSSSSVNQKPSVLETHDPYDNTM